MPVRTPDQALKARGPMRNVRVVAITLSVGALFVRCDCVDCAGGSDSDHQAGRRESKSASYRGVGEACIDDFTEDETWGCGGASAAETCAEGLTCCPKPSDGASYPRYICVASARCASTKVGGFCNSHRDCAIGQDCVSSICLARLYEPCTSDDHCVTQFCQVGHCDYPQPDAAVVLPQPLDAAADGPAANGVAADGSAADGSAPDGSAPDGAVAADAASGS